MRFNVWAKKKKETPPPGNATPQVVEEDFSDASGSQSESNEEREAPRNTGESNRQQVRQDGAAGGKKNGAANPSRGGAAALVQRVDSGCLERKNIILFYLCFAAINWFFLILSTAISQLDQVGGGCYTFWGYKSNCDTVSYTNRTQLILCKDMKQRLQTGAAFSIISILLMTVVLYLTLSALMEQRMAARQNQSTPQLISNKWVIVGLAAAAMLCELICWAMTASIYSSRYCEDKLLPRTSVYGAGFGLLMTAWTLGVVALVVFGVLA